MDNDVLTNSIVLNYRISGPRMGNVTCSAYAGLRKKLLTEGHQLCGHVYVDFASDVDMAYYRSEEFMNRLIRLYLLGLDYKELGINIVTIG